jgi:hypothetical protein
MHHLIVPEREHGSLLEDRVAVTIKRRPTTEQSRGNRARGFRRVSNAIECAPQLVPRIRHPGEQARNEYDAALSRQV